MIFWIGLIVGTLIGFGFGLMLFGRELNRLRFASKIRGELITDLILMMVNEDGDACGVCGKGSSKARKSKGKRASH